LPYFFKNGFCTDRLAYRNLFNLNWVGSRHYGKPTKFQTKRVKKSGREAVAKTALKM